MLDFTKYSDQELEALRKAISKEQRKREKKAFPYKVGDCFISIEEPDYFVCRIDAFTTRTIEVTILSIRNKEFHCFNSTYDYRGFIRDWKQRIDSKIFDVYIDINTAIGALEKQLIDKIKELCQELK